MRIAKNKKKPILDIHPACIGDNNDIQKNKDNDNGEEIYMVDAVTGEVLR